jgi:hypothetical protein
MNNNTSTFKRIFELAAAIVLALIAWQIFGGIVMFAVRLVLSVIVFGAVFSLIEWALFRRKNLTQ